MYKLVALAALLIASGQPPIFDDLESGGGDWSAEGNWSLVTGTAHSPVTAWAGELVTPGIPLTLTLQVPLDLSGARRARLTFWYSQTLSADAIGVVELSVDGGEHWTAVAPHTGETGEWRWRTLDLTPFTEPGLPPLRLRFRFFPAKPTDYWLIDDVQVEALPTPARFALPFEDNVEGWRKWDATGGWARTDATAHSPRLAWQTDTPGATLTLAGALDLREAVSPTLTFWQRFDLAEGSEGQMMASSDEGVTWQSVLTITDPISDWTQMEVDLSAYTGQEVELAFYLSKVVTETQGSGAGILHMPRQAGYTDQLPGEDYAVNDQKNLPISPLVTLVILAVPALAVVWIQRKERRTFRWIWAAMALAVGAGLGCGIGYNIPTNPYPGENQIDDVLGEIEPIVLAESEPLLAELSPDGKWLLMMNGDREWYLIDLDSDQTHSLGRWGQHAGWINDTYAVIGFGMLYAPDQTMWSLEHRHPGSDDLGGLEEADHIYALKNLGGGVSVLVTIDPNFPYYITVTWDGDELEEHLSGIPHTIIQAGGVLGINTREQRGYSPDGRYYITNRPFAEPDEDLAYEQEAMFDAATDEEIAHAYKYGWSTYFLGWAHDSSGAYFMFMPRGVDADVLHPRHPIYKLLVPGATPRGTPAPMYTPTPSGESRVPGAAQPARVSYRPDTLAQTGTGTGWALDDFDVRNVVPPLVHTLPFSDDMELPTANWRAVNGWQPVTETAHSGVTAWQGYAGDSSLILVDQLDLADATSPVLTFWQQFTLPEESTGQVMASSDGGLTWQPVLTITDPITGWTQVEVDLSAYAGQQVGLAFVLENVASGGAGVAGWYVDDVVVKDLRLPADQTYAPCEYSIGCSTHHTNWAREVINTRTGNYHYNQQDFSIPVLGGPLRFERSYNSQAIGLYTTPMGRGWTHNYAMDLTFPGDPGGELNTVIVKGYRGSRFRFADNGDGIYAPFPGVWATLTRTLTLPYTYTLTGVDQSAYIFNDTGRLAETRDPQGHAVTLVYSGTQLARVEDATEKRFLAFDYDDDGRLIEVRDPVSRTVRYGYENSDLVVVTDTLTHTWTYVYTGTHLLYEVYDPLTHLVERTEYDGQDRTVRQWQGMTSGEPLRIHYGVTDTTTITDPLGHVTVDQYDTRGTLVSWSDAAGSSARTYDNWLNWTSTTDANDNTTDYVFSQVGQPEVVEDALDGVTRMEYDDLNHLVAITDALTNTTRYEYDGNLLVIVTDTLTGTVVYSYTDGLLTQVVNHGITTTYDYNDFGQRTVVTDAMDNATFYEYDGVGRLITTTAFNGLMTVNEYDNGDDLIRMTRNYTTTTDEPKYLDMYNLVTEYKYNKVGNRTHVTDTLDHVTRSWYDEANRLIRTQDAGGKITTYGYDAVGNQILVTDTLSHVTRSWYDELNRLISTTQNYSPTIYPDHGPGNAWNLTIWYGYDAVGNQTRVTDTLGHVTLTEYDPLNRPITVTVNFTTAQRADTNIRTIYGYDAVGNTITTTDTAGQVTHTWYDALNRPIKVMVNYVDGVYESDHPDEDLISLTIYDEDTGWVTARVQLSGTLRITTSYEYDGLGRLVTTTNALSGTSVMYYDALGRQTQVTDAEDNSTYYEYDAAGRLIATTDEPGNTTRYGYDALGQRVAVTDALTHTTWYAYDALGRTVAVTDALTRTTRYEQDDLGRLVTVIENYTGGEQTDDRDVHTTYGYDRLGNLTVITDAHGYTATYTYDGVNRRVTEKDALCHVTAYVYDGLGRRTTVVYPDAGGPITVTTAYNLLGWPEQVEYPAVGDVPSFTVEYAYDKVGHRTAVTDATGTTTTEYDGLYRPITVTSPATGTVGYRYDAVGNRTRLIYPTDKTVTYAYDEANRLELVKNWDDSETTYDYDEAGRLLTTTLPNGVQTTYDYDDAGRLVEIEHSRDGAVLARYEYELDGVGNRTRVAEFLLPAGAGGLAALDDAVGLAARPAYPELTGLSVGEVVGQAVGPRAPGLSASGPVARLEIRLERTRLTADGRDSTRLVVLATDERGQPVADGTPVYLQAEGGRVSPGEAKTSGGLVFARLQSGGRAREGRVVARAGTASVEVSFELMALETGEIRLDDGAAPTDGPLPFDLEEVVERARNTIQVAERGLPFVEGQGHRAFFEAGSLRFAPLEAPAPTALEATTSLTVTPGLPLTATLNPDVPLTLTVELAAITVGGRPLFEGPARADAQLDGNVARFERGRGVVEEFVARDAGVEQRWWIETDPGLKGDLVVVVEVETALELELDAGGDGFVFQAAGKRGRTATPVARYGRALALDGAGRSQQARLRAKDMKCPSRDSGLYCYRLEMTFPAEWLAEARYPLLIDPFIQGLLNLATETQEDDQKAPYVAYNANDDEYLAVWTDYRDSANNPHIYAQRVSDEGLLVGENFTVTTASYRQINPRVAYAEGEGVYLVAWRHYPGSSNYTFHVYGQRISRTGERLSDALNIASGSATWRRRSPTDIVYNSKSDEFLVLWQDIRTGWWNIWGRHVPVTGTMSSEEIQITFNRTKHEAGGVGAYNLDEDQYLIVWNYRSSPSSHRDLRARRMTGSGTVTSTETIYVATGSGHQTGADVVYLAEVERYAVVWQDSGGGDYNVNGRLVSSAGTLDGGNYIISGETQNEYRPRLDLDGSGGALVVWERDNGGEDGYDLYGRRLGSDGQPLGNPLTILEADENQQLPRVAGNGAGRYLLTWQDNRNGNWDVYGVLYEPEIVREIAYAYDGLNRLISATYSTGEHFEYAYDEVGNRKAMTSTTPLSGTVVTTYEYDNANRLTDRAVSDGRVYSYTWSARGQMLAEWTQGVPVRTFTYDGAGQMVEATVFTLTTRFKYNGLGARVAVEVVGQGATTYTLDYAAGNRILAETTGAGSTLYLYGRDCLGELRDDSWLYYLSDAEGLVRQGVDEQGEVVSTWLFDPDGTVLEGPGGPVSHLVCGGVYDWSTGLIYKDRHYFDPMLGIWLALIPLIVVQSWRGRRKKRRGFLWYVLVLLAMFVGGSLTACKKEEIPWEEVEKTLCVEIPTDEFRTSQTVNVYHVSGPDATIYGEYEWRVRFELEDKAAADGWIIQEINSTLQLNLRDGSTEARTLHYYEAWPVKEGGGESNKARGAPWARYNDVYELAYMVDPEELAEKIKNGKDTVQGIVKFYEGELPPSFDEGKVKEAGTWLHSSHAPPPFWDGCGTAHDIEIEWDGESASGYMRTGNQIHRFTVP